MRGMGEYLMRWAKRDLKVIEKAGGDQAHDAFTNEPSQALFDVMAHIISDPTGIR